jgi:hypothetical protein
MVVMVVMVVLVVVMAVLCKGWWWWWWLFGTGGGEAPPRAHGLWHFMIRSHLSVEFFCCIRVLLERVPLRLVFTNLSKWPCSVKAST